MAKVVHADFVVDGSEEAREVFIKTTRFVKQESCDCWGNDLLHVSGDFEGYIAPTEEKNIDLQVIKRDKYTEEDYALISQLTLEQKTRLLDCSVELYTYLGEDAIIHEVYEKGRLTKREKKRQVELDAMEYAAMLLCERSKKKTGSWGRWKVTKEGYNLAKQCIEEAEKKYGVKL